MDSKHENAAKICRETSEGLIDINRQLLGVETREWLYCTIQDCVDACIRCAEECESKSMNARPAMMCVDKCSTVIQCCKYSESDPVTDKVKAICEKCMAVCKKLLTYGSE